MKESWTACSLKMDAAHVWHRHCSTGTVAHPSSLDGKLLLETKADLLNLFFFGEFEDPLPDVCPSCNLPFDFS